eukprot:SAG31_NODE_34_length_31842_cov_31.677850_28_plen_85_part_00
MILASSARIAADERSWFDACAAAVCEIITQLVNAAYAHRRMCHTRLRLHVQRLAADTGSNTLSCASGWATRPNASTAAITDEAS